MQAVLFQPLPEELHALTLADTNIRLSSDEMAAIDPNRVEETIALPDGGYFGILTVFHELHCLVRTIPIMQITLQKTQKDLSKPLETPSSLHVPFLLFP